MALAHKVLLPTLAIAGGGFATQAQAQVQFTQTFNFTPVSNEALGVNIGNNATDQYTFKNDSLPQGQVYTLTGSGTSAIDPNPTFMGSIPPENGQFTSNSVSTNFKGDSPGADFYYNLRFDIGVQTYYGYAHFTNSGTTLAEITYSATAAGAAPEPEAWGLMILGFGAAGSALRRGRRKRQLAAA